MISCKKNGKVGSINYVLIEEYEDGEETKEIRVKKEKNNEFSTDFQRYDKSFSFLYTDILEKNRSIVVDAKHTYIYWNPSKPILIKQLRIISQSQIIRLISLCVSAWWWSYILSVATAWMKHFSYLVRIKVRSKKNKLINKKKNKNKKNVIRVRFTLHHASYRSRIETIEEEK